MSWYYAENNERRGPFEDPAFEALVQVGTIKPETLVWREGMENWLPFSSANYISPAAGGPPPIEAATTSPRTGEEMGMCSESGRILPRSELIEIDGRLVSAEYKNVVLQRIREGLSSGGFAEDPEAIAERILKHGWDLRAGSCIARGWGVVKQNFWLCVGATFLVYLVIGAAGMIPFGGLVVQGPLIGGLYWMLLKLIRREPAAVGDAFQGFNRGWGQLVMASVMGTLMILPCILPGMIMLIVATTRGSENESSALAVAGGVLFLVGMLVAIYFIVGWIFALALVADKRIAWWPAMKLSRRVVNLHWWKIFWLLFLVGLIIGALVFVAIMFFGIIIALASRGDSSATGLYVGGGILLGTVMAGLFFAVLPLGFSAIMVAYEDIFAQPALP